jgi:hypothetical protein
MSKVKASPPTVTSIGKREAQAWLLKQLGYERVLARLRAAHAADQAGERQAGGRAA